MDDFFYWTGDDGSTDDPKWIRAALKAGIVRIENGGTANVCLVIHNRRFPRFSVIMPRDVEGSGSSTGNENSPPG